MLTLLAAATMLAAPQTFEGLTIDLPAKASQTQVAPERRVWEAVDIQTFANGQKQVNHNVTISVTDFAPRGAKPTPEEMFTAHEMNFRGRAGFTNVFAKRTEGKAGAVNGLMLYGYGRDAEGNSKTLTSAAFSKGTKLYEVIWVTDSHLREAPLASIPKIKFEGVPVTSWTSSAEGEYLMVGFPFAVYGKLFIGAEMLKPERGYTSGYFASTLTGKDAIVDTRFVAVKLKPSDRRTDREIFKDLAAISMTPFSAESRIPDIANGMSDKTIEFVDEFDTTVAARAVFLHKGSYAVLLTVTGDKSAAVLAELKKPKIVSGS